MATRADAPLWRETVKAGALRSWSLAVAIALLLLTAAMALALASYHPGDSSLNTAGGGVENLLGPAGAWFADIALMLFGPAGALLLPVGPIVAMRLWRDEPAGAWGRMLRTALAGVALMAVALACVAPGAVPALPFGWGGAVGLAVVAGARWAMAFLDNPAISWWGLVALGLLTGFAGVIVWGRSLEIDFGRLARRRIRARADDDYLYDDEDEEQLEDSQALAPAPSRREARVEAPTEPEARPAPVIGERKLAPTAAKPKPQADATATSRDTYVLPTLDMLTPAPVSNSGPVDKAALERNARLLETVLDDFNVKGDIVEVRPGPVVTMYELEPAPGIKASRVIQLADDIARNMSAISARVAVIPGRNVIGIELPNQKRESVSLHELVGSQTFDDLTAQLPVILGKNIAGDPV
ncbi:DNA translocase FtsK 4TM domain-containing protein, partial [Sphingomonas sp.]|uniref:DNA translocase FtsK 4TM domain-containing protein n=1 Tax=Sphingomonas sp. TaxID=28214 RepID=UPI0035C85A64